MGCSAVMFRHRLRELGMKSILIQSPFQGNILRPLDDVFDCFGTEVDRSLPGTLGVSSHLWENESVLQRFTDR